MPPLQTVPIIQVPGGVAIPATPTIAVDTGGNYVGPGFPTTEVAASKTGFPLGRNGAAGDFVDRILIVPASTSPGAVTLVDGETSIPVFAGGASSVADLRPFVLDLGYVSADGGWTLTTGANVSAVVNGRFTDDPPEGMAWVVDEDGNYVMHGNDYVYTEEG